MIEPHKEREGLLYGFAGVLCFSLTLPATRVAVASLDPKIVGLGRVVVAAILAAIVLLVTRQSLPRRKYLPGLVIVTLGTVLGFPFLSAWATARLPASHGAIVLGLLPLGTALAAALTSGERPTRGFWAASIAGSAVVLAYAVSQGAGQLQFADLVLLLAVVGAALGYAEGGRLAKEMGGWQVISWALLLGAPFILVPVALAVAQHGLVAPAQAWLGFGYVSLFSQFLGFFPWYHGLVLGGVARVSQLQLLQPFLTIVAAVLLLGEPLTLPSLLAAALVVATIALGRRAGVRQRDPSPVSTVSGIPE